MDVEIVGAISSPTLKDLNTKAIEKLYELMDGMDSKSNPDMIRACVESLAKLNSSIKGSDILPAAETPEERMVRETKEAIANAIGG